MSQVLLKELYPSVEKGLTTTSTRTALEKSLSDYMNRNVARLTTLGPLYRTIYTEEDRSHLYEATHTSPKVVMDLLRTIPNIKSQKIILKEPYFTLLSVGTRAALVKKDDRLLISMQQMMVLSMMPGLHFKYFKHEPNPDIMEFTMNNLSNKFTVRREGSFFNALMVSIQAAMRIHKERLLKGDDLLLIAYVLDVKTRLNGIYKSLAKEFYKNVEKGLYLSKEIDNFDDENYGMYDSNSYAVERITNKVVSHLVVHGPSMKIVSISANINKVSVSELRNYTTTMITTTHREDIRSITENIVSIYLLDRKKRPEDINTTQFIVDCFDIYRTSNIQDKKVASIKSILDQWIRDLGTYEKTNNKGTINNFRRALYTFFIYSIQTINMA